MYTLDSIIPKREQGSEIPLLCITDLHSKIETAYYMLYSAVAFVLGKKAVILCNSLTYNLIKVGVKNLFPAWKPAIKPSRNTYVTLPELCF